MTFASTPTQSYKLSFGGSLASKISTAEHVFGGQHELLDADCPNCHKPLLRFLALNTRDPKLGLKTLQCSVVSLLWCWTCNVAQTPFFYRQIDATRIRILKYGRGGVTKTFPYRDYPDAFPRRTCRLKIMTGKEKNSILSYYQKSGELPLKSTMQHQVGGIPFLWRELNDARLNCPLCREAMPFLAVISDDGGAGVSICGNTALRHVFHFCSKCSVVGAYQDCD